jgi:hypothetical protein
MVDAAPAFGRYFAVDRRPREHFFDVLQADAIP